jgi:prepilin-type N-terminal cleavage/methylation domain-containing protein/prepilin-type processing-associated H-X9-DG protein
MKIRGWKKGFTLVELLIAIAVIGILISLLVPAVNKVLESARRAKGANSLKQIAMAYASYCNDDVNSRNIGGDTITNGVEWALVLAKGGYLNDPNIYCFSGDSGASKVIKKAIVDPSGTNNNAWGTGTVEFSVYVIKDIPTDAPLSTTPIAFTRGKPETANDDAGKLAKWPWNPGVIGTANNGVYGNKGGYIAYLDGHVEWYDDLGEAGNGKLIGWDGEMTNDIARTIPATAKILSANGEVN